MDSSSTPGEGGRSWDGGGEERRKERSGGGNYLMLGEKKREQLFSRKGGNWDLGGFKYSLELHFVLH